MQNRVGPPDVPSGRPELRWGSGRLPRRPGRRCSPTLPAPSVLRGGQMWDRREGRSTTRVGARRESRRRSERDARGRSRSPQGCTTLGPESLHSLRTPTQESEKVGERRKGKESQPPGMHHVGPRVAALPSNPLNVGLRHSRQGARRRKSRPRAARDARLAPVEDDADAPAVWLA
jgi:hypothetical protein